MVLAQFYMLAMGPDRQFIAVQVGEVKAAAAGEAEFGAADAATGPGDGLSGQGQVVGVENDQRATRTHRW